MKRTQLNLRLSKEAVERLNEPFKKEDLHPLIRKIAGSVRNGDQPIRNVVMKELTGKYGN